MTQLKGGKGNISSDIMSIFQTAIFVSPYKYGHHSVSEG